MRILKNPPWKKKSRRTDAEAHSHFQAREIGGCWRRHGTPRGAGWKLPNTSTLPHEKLCFQNIPRSSGLAVRVALGCHPVLMRLSWASLQTHTCWAPVPQEDPQGTMPSA